MLVTDANPPAVEPFFPAGACDHPAGPLAASAARAMAGAGGSSFEARDSRQLGAVTKEDANGGKRKREENVGKKPKVSKEEAAALARREAARARVQARSMKGFGLQ